MALAVLAPLQVCAFGASKARARLTLGLVGDSHAAGGQRPGPACAVPRVTVLRKLRRLRATW